MFEIVNNESFSENADNFYAVICYQRDVSLFALNYSTYFVFLSLLMVWYLGVNVPHNLGIIQSTKRNMYRGSYRA